MISLAALDIVNITLRRVTRIRVTLNLLSYTRSYPNIEIINLFKYAQKSFPSKGFILNHVSFNKVIY